MSLRLPCLALFIVGCGAATPTAPMAIEPTPAETCTIEPSGTWTAPHAELHWVNGTLFFDANGAGLWRTNDGAPELLLAESTFRPGGRWRPTHVAWAEGWWAALDEEGQLVRGSLGPSVEVPPLTLPACTWMGDETRRGSIERFTNGDWLLGCDRQIVIADAAGRELSRFTRSPFTVGELPLEIEGRRLVVAWGTHHGVAAFDAASGRIVWRSELRRTTITVAVSPEAPQVLVTHFENEGGRRIEGGRSGLFGLDPRTGALVWELRYPGPWPREGVDPRSASQLVPRWIDARHVSLEGLRLADFEPVGGREIQRLTLGEGASPPVPDGPALPLDELYGAAMVLPDGTSFGVSGGLYVERGPDGELRSELSISEAGGARRWADGRVVCPEDSCPWARPCEAR